MDSQAEHVSGEQGKHNHISRTDERQQSPWRLCGAYMPLSVQGHLGQLDGSMRRCILPRQGGNHRRTIYCLASGFRKRQWHLRSADYVSTKE